jgi:hypothetical protein
VESSPGSATHITAQRGHSSVATASAACCMSTSELRREWNLVLTRFRLKLQRFLDLSDEPLAKLAREVRSVRVERRREYEQIVKARRRAAEGWMVSNCRSPGRATLPVPQREVVVPGCAGFVRTSFALLLLRLSRTCRFRSKEC